MQLRVQWLPRDVNVWLQDDVASWMKEAQTVQDDREKKMTSNLLGMSLEEVCIYA